MNTKIIYDYGLEELKNAVVLQAVEDYRKALCREHKLRFIRENLKHSQDYTFEERMKLMCENARKFFRNRLWIQDCEKFFQGDWISAWTKADGKAIQKFVKNECIQYDYDLKKIRKIHSKSASMEEVEALAI